MEKDISISTLTSKIVKRIVFWAGESYFWTIIVLLIFFIFIVPLVGSLQDLVKKIPYENYLGGFAFYIYLNFRPLDYILTVTTVIFAILFFFVRRRLLKISEIKENFSKGLNKWSMTIGSGWTIQDCTDRNGRMLSVTNSSLPGTLKSAYGWYDYEISFQAKIDSTSANPNIGIVVRSESNFNGILLQITKTHFRPHFLSNGTFILDNKNIEQLPTVLTTDTWIDVRLTVEGNDIEIYIYNYKLNYKIRSLTYKVDNIRIGIDTNLQDIESDNIAIEAEESNWYEEFNKVAKLPAGERSEAYRKLPVVRPYTTIMLDYQKGSVGFRESGSEHTYFRKLSVKSLA